MASRNEASFLAPTLSVVVPAMNEEATVHELAEGVIGSCAEAGIDLELIFVDDGSTDDTWERIRQLSAEHPEVVHAIRLRRNFGKSQALAAAFRVFRGQYVITMDADLQDDPSELPGMLSKAQEGYDLVVGWKRDRQDPRSKVISSRIFNCLANRLSGLELHDHNCGLKCYHRSVVLDLRLYGDMHRMVPSLAAARGFSVVEVPVAHHPRRFGVSKYGFGRAFRSAFDLATVFFLKRFYDRPAHLIGPIAVLVFGIGIMATAGGLVRDLLSGQGKVLLVIGPTAILASLVLVCTALLAELLVHEHLARLWRPPISETTGGLASVVLKPQQGSVEPSEPDGARESRPLLMVGGPEDDGDL